MSTGSTRRNGRAELAICLSLLAIITGAGIGLALARRNPIDPRLAIAPGELTFGPVWEQPAFRHAIQVHNPSGRIDVRYEREQEPRWIPSSWTTTSWMPTGEVSTESKNTDVEVDLGLPLSEKTFNIDYPPGAHVLDGRRKDSAVVVAEDGRVVPYRLGQARETAAGSGNWLWISLAVGGAAIIGLASFLRNRQTASGG